MTDYYIHRNGDVVAHGSGRRKEETPEHGQNKKKFYFSYSHYRKIASAMEKMKDERKNRLIFITYTFPENIINNEKTNKLLSNHLENLQKNYKLHSYIWVVERQNRGAVHYHCIYDIPYTSVERINSSFSRSASRFGIRIAKNSVRLNPKGSLVTNGPGAVKYICKYITKNINKPFPARIYSISHNIIEKPLKVSGETFRKMITGRKETHYDWNTVYYGRPFTVNDWKNIEKSSIEYEKLTAKIDMKREISRISHEMNLKKVENFLKKHEKDGYFRKNHILERSVLQKVTDRNPENIQKNLEFIE